MSMGQMIEQEITKAIDKKINDSEGKAKKLIDTIEGKISQLQNLTTLKDRIDTLEKEKSSLQEKIKELESKNTSSEENHRSHGNRLRSLEEKVSGRIRQKQTGDGKNRVYSFHFPDPKKICEIHYTKDGKANLVKYENNQFNGDVESGRFVSGKIEVTLKAPADKDTDVVLEYSTKNYEQKIKELSDQNTKLEKRFDEVDNRVKEAGKRLFEDAK